MGWCGRAKPWCPPRFHTFSYQILTAWRGVIFLCMSILGMEGKVGDPVGLRGLAAPHRLRSLPPLGLRWESWLMGWCGRAKPRGPQRSHTFPTLHWVVATRGVTFRIHRCIPPCSLTILPLTPPLLPSLRLRPRHHPCCMCTVGRRLVLLQFFVLRVGLNVGLMLRCRMANASDVLTRPFTHLHATTAQHLLRSGIQVLLSEARLL